MPLSDFHLRASIAVSDVQRAMVFYEGMLGLRALQSGPSAEIVDGSRVYGSGDRSALNVYQSATAGQSSATLATWYVDDIGHVVDELAAAGVEFTRYGGLNTTSKASRRGPAVAASRGSKIRTATRSRSRPTPERRAGLNSSAANGDGLGTHRRRHFI
jgi:catechol 2,3-dioxygenase-like lactoylglutathione lyase family enzyme